MSSGSDSLGPVPVEELQRRVAAAVRSLPPQRRELAAARGLVLAEDIVASVALPPFDNSAMDGYAVRSGDVATASEAAPVTLPVIGEIGAGDSTGTAVRRLGAGQAAKIMTGARVPDGCDAVVPYEWTDRGTATVIVRRPPAMRQHIRAAGDDVAAGDRVLDAGTVLGPRQLGLCAGIGLAEVSARPAPRVVIISTGSELVQPGLPLGPDSIYDSNSALIAAAAESAGAIARRVGIVPDDPVGFDRALRAELAEADLVVTSGGVSQGDFDVVKEALTGSGDVWFGPVAMQPGKPQGFGVIDDVPIFTLPGNPVSSYISFEVFVRPAIRQMMGLSPVHRPVRPARLGSAVTSPPGRRQYLRGRYPADEPVGQIDRAVLGSVVPVGGAGSHLLGSLARANALIVIGEDVTSVAEGEVVEVLALDLDP
ncbi:MAG: molybdotransferase-like divisome protein Glp [Nocardioides sp.]